MTVSSFHLCSIDTKGEGSFNLVETYYCGNLIAAEVNSMQVNAAAAGGMYQTGE